MKIFQKVRFLTAFISVSMIPYLSIAQTQTETLTASGLSQQVEIIKDQWGISHIYAQNQHDLFFAQGYNAAQDRLFQFEIWRLNATGTMAEILGERALQHDIGARLFTPRVDLEQELNHYHPDGVMIINAFVDGINAYVDEANRQPDSLPIEFKLLGIKPKHWTPWVVVSRHNGLRRNAGNEITNARFAAKAGIDLLNEYLETEPGDPVLKVAEGLDISMIPDNVLDLYNASRRTPRLLPSDIADPAKRREGLPDADESQDSYDEYTDIDVGSNNWVLAGSRTFSGNPIMANDPHRTQSVPSLRYLVHLNAPGWNAIGAGEPVLPGISIGHNDFGAWGLTIFSIDQEDIYVYDTNPANPNQYKYHDKWIAMNVITENFGIKGKSNATADLKYTRHGPVIFEDQDNNKAYVLRAGWMEIGGAPYLASLRMDVAKNWEEFRDGCTYSHIPSENMIWADKEGNIGWQAVGITPIRKNWYGLLPVPGDGRYEWDGFLPIRELPNSLNPRKGYIATANQNNIPLGYEYRLGYAWADKFRFSRVSEVIESGRKLTVMDNMLLQLDELSIPARNIVPLIKETIFRDKNVKQAADMLLSWNYVMDKNSTAAVIYAEWQKMFRIEVKDTMIPEQLVSIAPRISLTKVMNSLISPESRLGDNPLISRDEILSRSLVRAVEQLKKRLGPDMKKWRYGSEKYHYLKLSHLLSGAVNDETSQMLDVGPVPRGGNGSTPNQTNDGYNQRSGGSFRIIADTNDWDNSVGTNNPGQSGNPESPHYSDLLKIWADGKYFPVLFSRSKVERAVKTITILKPGR